jgi:hypothetical protein
MRRLSLWCSLVVALAAWWLAPLAAECCPFCGGVMLTLSDEMKASEVVVIAQIAEKPPAPPTDPLQAGLAVSKTKFKVIEVIKGQDILGDAQEIELLYFGQEQADRKFLVQGSRLPDLAFNTPVPLTDRALEYIRKLPSLPEKGPERLSFFQDYLEDPEDMLARDAYDEFAKAPYAEVKALGDRLYHDKFVAWIKDLDTSTSHRRLYLTLLGVCGRDDQRPEDIAMLEEAITAEGDAPKPALDATIACYLTFTGEKGLPLVEDRFLKNKDCSYSDTYSAIMALRFHGQEEEIISKERLLAALRNLLDRPELADLIIPDLARWQDWSAMERLVTLFKEADDKSSWVRVPVVQYLKVCPLPEAAKHLEELTQIDPEAVKRASFFVPLGGAAPKPVPPADGALAGDPQPSDPAPAPGEAAGPATPEPTADSTAVTQADTADVGDAAVDEEEEPQPAGTAAAPEEPPAGTEGGDASPPIAAADAPAGPGPPTGDAPPPEPSSSDTSADAAAETPVATVSSSRPAAKADAKAARQSENTWAARLVVLVPLGLGALLFLGLLAILGGGRRQAAKVGSS